MCTLSPERNQRCLCSGENARMLNVSSADYIDCMGTLQLRCCQSIRELSDCIKNILFCVPKMNKDLAGLERHEGEYVRILILEWTILLKKPTNMFLWLYIFMKSLHNMFFRCMNIKRCECWILTPYRLQYLCSPLLLLQKELLCQ